MMKYTSNRYWLVYETCRAKYNCWFAEKRAHNIKWWLQTEQVMDARKLVGERK